MSSWLRDPWGPDSHLLICHSLNAVNKNCLVGLRNHAYIKFTIATPTAKLPTFVRLTSLDPQNNL